MSGSQSHSPYYGMKTKSIGSSASPVLRSSGTKEPFAGLRKDAIESQHRCTRFIPTEAEATVQPNVIATEENRTCDARPLASGQHPLW